ncbi:MAG: BadF/BadG/BcrA/BcrD ATPase family protein, partial [Desulfobacterales bacterium]
MERTNLNQYYAGIDIGSVSLKCIVINSGKEVVFEFPYKRHFGRPDEETMNLIESLFNKFGKNKFRSIAFTGSHGKKLSQKLGTFYEYETICQVLGVLHIIPDAKSIISMGGQDTALFQIHHHDSGWELDSFNSNGPCASGTGSFIDQQAERLATSLYAQHKDTSQSHIDNILTDFIQLGLNSKRPASVACRCTVFTKSDMIHLQNRGEKLEDIIYGLHVGNARNYISTVVSNVELQDPIVFIGGLSLNALQVKAFQTYYPNLIIPAYNTSAGALGVALKALQMKHQDDIGIDDLRTRDFCGSHSVPQAPKLILRKTRFPVIEEVQKKLSLNRARAYLGIDIGSTTSKYALISESHELIHKCYLPTRGKPIEVTKNLLQNILDEVGDSVEIIGTAATGSGRYVVG